MGTEGQWVVNTDDPKNPWFDWDGEDWVEGTAWCEKPEQPDDVIVKDREYNHLVSYKPSLDKMFTNSKP